MLTAWLIYDYLKKKTDITYGLMGALFFLSIPIIVKLSITVYVDLGLIFFSTTSLLFLLKWAENQFKLSYLIVSAIMCGLALGTKYNGLITLLLLTSLVPLIYIRHTHQKTKGQMKALAFGTIFLLIALTIFSPWMIRNYMWTKNPIYPLHNNLFQSIGSEGSPSESDPDTGKSKKSLGHFVVRKLVYGEKWWETLSIPVRIFFQGQDDNPKYFDGKLNPFLLFLPIFCFIQGRKRSLFIDYDRKIFAFFSVFFLLFAFFQTDMRIRWVSPMLPPLVMLSMIGLYEMNRFIMNRSYKQILKKILSGSVYASIIVLFTINFIYIFNQFQYVDPFSYIHGKLNRGEYIEKFRPEYRVIQYANKNLSENAKILALFIGNRGYYIDREVFFGQGWFQKHIQNAGSSDAILIPLKKNGTTHLLIRNELFSNWINRSFNQREKKIFISFLSGHAILLHSHAGYSLFEIS